MSKFIKTLHDVSLGLFINASYGVIQGDIDLANTYVIAITIIAMYITNRSE